MRLAGGISALLLLILATGHALAAEPTTLKELQAAGRLEVKSAISPDDGLVPGQLARLSVIIATDRWFSGGTRITLPEVPGLVILQTEQFASNASEKRNGQSWVLQRWSLDVYPQRAGRFVVPPLTLKMKVNAAPGMDVEGELSAPAVSFSATLPPALEQVDQWVSAPAYEVSQSFDRPLDDLQVGDAFEREVVFEASGVMAMMLPAFEVAQQDGLAVYPAPPGLENRSNRGETTARRSQRISYVIEAEGEYLLPSREFFWWDTERGQLKLLSLPDQRFTVGAGTTAIDPEPGAATATWLLPLLKAAAGLAAAGLALWWGVRRLPPAWRRKQRARVVHLWRWLGDLRRPALPSRLNPGSSAGE